MMRIRDTIMFSIVISLFFQVSLVSKPAAPQYVKPKQATSKSYKPRSSLQKPVDPELEWKDCGDCCLRGIFGNSLTNISIPFIKGFIKDMTIHGDHLYLLIQDFNLITDAIFVIKRDSGSIKAIWGIGKHDAQAITSDGKSLWVLSRSNKYFLRRLSLLGKGIGDISFKSMPEGAVSGLTSANGTLVFAIHSGNSSDIYLFDPIKKLLKKIHSFHGTIHAVTFFQNNLVAYLNEFDAYRNNWLLIIDMKEGLKKKMCFVNANPACFTSDLKNIYMLERRDAGAFVYPIVFLVDRNTILSNPHIRRIEINFQLVSGNSNPYNADLWIPYPIDRNFQNIRKVVVEPRPRDIVQDKYGNRWAHIRWERADASVKVILKFDILTSDVAYTIDRDSQVTGNTIPADIQSTFLAETYYFDTSSYIIKSHSTRIDMKGPFLSRIMAIRNYIVGAVLYNGRNGGWSRASEYLYKGRGNSYGSTLSFAAMARFLGIPARAAGGVLLDEPEDYYAENDFAWSQVYFPGFGWIDVETGSDKPARSTEYIAHRSNRYFVAFEGDFDKADFTTVFAETDWRGVFKWTSLDRNRKADIEFGRIVVKARELKQ